MQRRGAEPGSGLGDLGRLAAEQETMLRSLIHAQDTVSDEPRAEADLDARALPLIQKHRLEPLPKLRQILRDEGVNIPPRRIELIAARNGIITSAARA